MYWIKSLFYKYLIHRIYERDIFIYFIWLEILN